MKKLLLLPIILLAFAACKKEENPETFSEAALQDKMTAIDGTEMSFKDVLEQYKTKPIVIDVWASWCPDCIKGMPKLQACRNNSLMWCIFSFRMTKLLNRGRKALTNMA